MKKLLLSLLVACAIGCSNPNKRPTPYNWPKAKAPVAAVNPHQRIIHGDTVIDNYYWMIDYFKKGKDSTKVVDYLKAENNYLDTMMKGTKKLQQALFQEMKGRVKEKDESVPELRNGYYYYTRTETGSEYYKYCRKKGSLKAPEEVLLDVDQLAKGHSYYGVSEFTVSPDNKLLAYGVDELSRRQYTLHIKNLETGETYSDRVSNTEDGYVWANDNRTLFYISKNPTTLLGEKVKRHVLGTKESTDQTVYDEKDNTNYLAISKSKNNKYVSILSGGTLTYEFRILDANDPNGKFKIFAPRTKDVRYTIYPTEDKFYILTNWKAKNFRLMECPLNKTTMENWKEVVPHRADVLLEDVQEFKDYLALVERKNGLSQLRIIRNDGADYHISFDEPVYAIGLSTNPEYNNKLLRYNYTSLTTPSSVYDYDVYTKKQQLMKRKEIVGGYNPKDYVSERIFATAKDGTKVPIALVYKKGTKKDGNAPLIMEGYGSYGVSYNATFWAARLAMLNRGFICAIANIRGGQEMGRQWYEDGKLMKKKNTFTDFIACGQYLIAQQYTSSSHLYASGGSAGGLLMGAVANMAPEGLFKGLIADVPFVDVVNTMLDESIPLTTNEFDEWGNPKQKPAYDYMKSYSPYENVTKKAYPNMLVTTGLHDSQVQYFEPAKWVAKLRATKTDQHVLLLKTNMDFGHGGASGRFDALKDEALRYAFILALEGIDK